jgi:hypothetical protein
VDSANFALPQFSEVRIDPVQRLYESAPLRAAAS